MTVRFLTMTATVLSGAMLMTPAPLQAAEVFSATATVKTADGKTASAPMTITIDRTLSKTEADTLIAAFKSGGAAALRKALVGVKPTGSVAIGAGKPTPARLAIERTTGSGKLLTIVTDRPLLFLGAAAPGAKPREGYDFAVVDIEVDASGNGSGTVAPAAKIKLNGDAFVVEDYASEVVRLSAVKKTK